MGKNNFIKILVISLGIMPFSTLSFAQENLDKTEVEKIEDVCKSIPISSGQIVGKDERGECFKRFVNLQFIFNLEALRSCHQMKEVYNRLNCLDVIKDKKYSFDQVTDCTKSVENRDDKNKIVCFSKNGMTNSNLPCLELKSIKARGKTAFVNIFRSMKGPRGDYTAPKCGNQFNEVARLLGDITCLDKR